MRAVFIREWPRANDIVWRLYQCDPGGRRPEWVIVSASDVAPAMIRRAGDLQAYTWRKRGLRGPKPETRIYPSDADGNPPPNFSEWLWEERNTLDHEATLRAAGYEPEGYP